MNKKVTSSILAALMIAGSTSFSAFAAMTNGTVVIGNKAFDLNYANDPANVLEITKEIVAGGKVYVKNFSGNWIDNITGSQINASIIPAVVYKSSTGVTNFDVGDKDQLSIKSVSPINVLAVTAGTLPILPTTINVILSDGITKSVDVIWNSAATAVETYAIAGAITINGTIVTYSNYAVSTSVTVNAAQTGGGGGGGGQPQTVVKTALTGAITVANTNKTTAVVSTDGTDILPTNKWVPTLVMTAYTNAIVAAQLVVNSAAATQAEVDSAVAAMTAATGNFNTAKASGIKAVVKTVLTDAITSANTNKTTATVSTDGANVLVTNYWVTGMIMTTYENAILTAQAVQGNASATQIEVDSAVAAMTTATANFNTAKALGALALTPQEIAAEAAVAAFEAAPITNIGQMDTATSLKTTAEAKVILVLDAAAKTAFTSRITTKTIAMAIAEINLVSIPSSMAIALTKYAQIIGLDFTDYNTLTNKVPVQTALLSPVFTTISQIKGAFDAAVMAQKTIETSSATMAVAISEINTATIDTMETAITKNALILGLDLTVYSGLYAFKIPVNAALTGKSFSTAIEIKSAFDVAVGLAKEARAVAAINAATAQTMAWEITMNANDLGLVLTDYNALLNKIPVQTAMLAQAFANISGVKAAFDLAVTTQKNIEAQIPLTTVSLNKASIIMLAGMNDNITATVLPANTVDKTVTWTSDNSALVTVDSTGKVVGVAPGTAIIKATTVGGKSNAVCTVRIVTEADAIYQVTQLSILNTATNIIVYSKALALNLTDYNLLTVDSQSSVQTALYGHSFLTAAALRSAFDAAVIAATPAPVTPIAPQVFANDIANTVSGIDTLMEYKLDGATGYIAYNPSVFSLLDLSGDHTLLVRYAANGIDPFGPDTVLTFTTNPLIVPAAPLVTNNNVLNTVIGLSLGMEYSFTGFDYIPYVNDATFYSLNNFSGDVILYVRIAATANNLASDDTVLTFTTN